MSTASFQSMLRATLAAACLIWAGGGRLVAHSDLEELLDEANARLTEDPKKAEHYLYRGDLYRIAGEWKKAAKDFEKARKLDPKLDRYWYCHGRMWYDSGSPGLAASDLTTYLSAHPDDAQALLVRGRAFSQLRRFRESIADYERCLRNLPRPGPEIFLELADACESHGDLGHAVTSVQLGLQRIGPAVSMQMRLIELFRKQSDYKSAQSVVDGLLRQSPEDEELLQVKAELRNLASAQEKKFGKAPGTGPEAGKAKR